MARTARIKSESGIYHIIIKGIDDRNIFIDNNDRKMFIEYIARAKVKGKFKLYGYCLMDNHVHILIKEIDEEIGTSIKRILVGFIQYHNKKYLKSGHLFGNRFNSEVVEKKEYFRKVLRYIHMNPIKAGIVNMPAEYTWSSFREYIGLNNSINVIDKECIDEYFGSIEYFREFMNEDTDDICLEHEKKNKYTDETLLDYIFENHKLNNLEFGTKQERNILIKKIRSETQASLRQLARIFGVSKGIIEIIVKGT